MPSKLVIFALTANDRKHPTLFIPDGGFNQSNTLFSLQCDDPGLFYLLLCCVQPMSPGCHVSQDSMSHQGCRKEGTRKREGNSCPPLLGNFQKLYIPTAVYMLLARI
jgi:hypothetical protein